MNSTEKEYCRLCAEKKLRNKLANFQNDAKMWQKIVDKLSRFNIVLDLHENILPRTVCFLCSKSLESALTFVAMVEHAQATLNDFTVVGVKKEENDSDDINIFNDLPDDSMDTNDEIDKEPNIKIEHSDENLSIDVYVYDSDKVNKFIEPPDDNKVFTDIKAKKVTSSIEIKLDNKECNNVQLKHQTPTINTFCEVKKDKTDTYTAPLNINIEVNKNNNVNTTQVIKGNEEYSAEFIDKEINRLAKVPLHAIKNTWKDFNWKCSYCETIFPNADELQSHSMQYHNTCNTYKCTDCNTRKSNLNVFIKHVQEHSKYLHYSCYKCFMKFTSPNEGRRHKQLHYTSDYICLGCNTSFPSQDELKAHVRAFYKIMCQKKNKHSHWPDDNFTCNECEKSFKSSVGLSKHLVVHTNRKRDYFCEICGKGFYNKIALTNHMIVHSDTKPYQCEICKYKFKNIYLLRYHAKVHSGEKPFMCDQCNQCFREKRHLVNHSRIHSDLLPHSCTQCDKKFRTKYYLQNHMRQHTGEKPYSCEICERTFTNWGNYNKHMKGKHGTDKSKKKRTPLGPHAIDPTTGDVIYPEMDKVLEWKKKMKEPLNSRKKKQDKLARNASDTPI